MPNRLVKSYAKKSGKSVDQIEGYWDEAKLSAKKAGFSKTEPGYWAYVNAITQKRAGLNEAMTFRDFLMFENEAVHARALLNTGFYGAVGAGCVIVAENTGRICMPKRSKSVMEPGTWGTWGGAVDPNESPRDAALREVKEEAGYDGELLLSQLHIYKHETGFKYYTFLARVREEFTPTLDWETEEHRWCLLESIPTPLHFGVQALMNDPMSKAKLVVACKPKNS